MTKIGIGAMGRGSVVLADKSVLCCLPLGIMLKDLIDKDRAAFGALLAANHVSKLYAFGSSVHGPFGPDSDVDVLVEVDASDEVAGGMLIKVWNGLEEIFQRPVDLLTESSLRNPYLRAEIERTKQLIYDGSKRQVLV